MERLKLASTVATATPMQYAVAEFLANGGYDHHLRRVRREYARRVAEMGQAVGNCFPPGTRVSRPQGAFVLWIECPPSVDAIRLYELALQAGMSLAPGPIFTAQDRYQNCLRLNAAYWLPQTAGALHSLGQLAHSLT